MNGIFADAFRTPIQISNSPPSLALRRGQPSAIAPIFDRRGSANWMSGLPDIRHLKPFYPRRSGSF
jgi:hypothetical protein